MPRRKKATGNDVRVFSMPKAKRKPTIVSMKKSLPEAKKSPLVATSSPKREWHLPMQFLIAGSAIAILMILGIVDRVTFSTLGSHAKEPVPVTIGIEHENPLTLSIVVARKNGSGYASITNRSFEQIRISVPSEWKRTEVTGAPLSAFTQDTPVFGFSRWTLPPHGGIKFLPDRAPEALFFDSDSMSTTEIDLQTVDLSDFASMSHVILLKDKALLKLWGSGE